VKEALYINKDIKGLIKRRRENIFNLKAEHRKGNQTFPKHCTQE